MIRLPTKEVFAVILGIMQDGGLPHIGCRCSRCSAAYQHETQPQYAACLAIVDKRQVIPAVWLIDATPDIKYQLDLLASILGPHPTQSHRLRQPEGIFLTHAHMGHIGGLPQLGPEAMGVRQLQLYAASDLLALLYSTQLWHPLTEHLDLRPLVANKPLTLAPGLTITPLPVPHRDEWDVGTFAFLINGPSHSLLYLPDIDAWEQWPLARELLTAVDIAMVDASFYTADELGGRPPVAHPLIPHTLDLFANLPCQLLLTHFNHTNPVLDVDSLERKVVLSAGVQLAQTGQSFSL